MNLAVEACGQIYFQHWQRESIWNACIRKIPEYELTFFLSPNSCQTVNYELSLNSK